jgi:hypothetical protein
MLTQNETAPNCQHCQDKKETVTATYEKIKKQFIIMKLWITQKVKSVPEYTKKTVIKKTAQTIVQGEAAIKDVYRKIYIIFKNMKQKLEKISTWAHIEAL